MSWRCGPGRGGSPRDGRGQRGVCSGKNHLDPYFLPSVKINFRWMTGPNATTKTLSEGNARARPAGRAEAERLDGAQPGRGATRAGPPSRASGIGGQHRGRRHDLPGVWGAPTPQEETPTRRKMRLRVRRKGAWPAPSLPGGRVGDAPHQKTDGLKKKKSIKNVEKALTIDPWMKFIFREAEAGFLRLTDLSRF